MPIATDEKFPCTRYGMWTALHAGAKRGKHHYVLCRCDCGTEREVACNSLVMGRSKGCGCVKQAIREKWKKEYPIGAQFHHWTVVGDTRANKYKAVEVYCRCVCGTEKWMEGEYLKSEGWQSCGCVPWTRAIDETGNKYGRYTVLRRDPASLGKVAKWICLCECGTTKSVEAHSLRSGHIKSCGCYQRDRLRKHDRSLTKEWNAWASMRSRCNNPNHKAYHNYGGRGIKVCERWMESFENFYADMGDSPADTELDRIDNEKGYSPENCRWATYQQQGNNRRNNRYLTFNGETHSLADWCRITGINRATLKYRLKAGFPIEEVFDTKSRNSGRELLKTGDPT